MEQTSSSLSSATVPITVRSVRSVASQRRCFLIDSLLEERQKRLAATVAAKRGANAFNPSEEPKREKEEIGKETMPDFHLEEKETINGTTNCGTDSEETAGEEVLPTFEDEKGTNTANDGSDQQQDDQSDQRGRQAEEGIGSEQQRKALLEALAKLVPKAVRQGGGETEVQTDGTTEKNTEKREGGEGGDTNLCQTKVSAEFLHKFHLFQQQLASSAAASAAWPFMGSNHFPIPTNCFRLPFFSSPPFSLNTLLNNGMSKCVTSQNPWRQLKPTIAMAPTVKCRNKTPNDWLMPNFFNVGPASAVLASIGAFRTAATAASAAPPTSAQNKESNGNRKSGNAANVSNSTNKNRSGRRQNNSTQNRISGRSSNVKKYRCDICDKTFSRSNTLITHKRIHTGEKPFRCEHCGRAFRQPGNLTRHAYTHTTVKPFVCSECGKAFNRASNLQSHVRVHSATGGKPGENGGGVGLKQCKRCQTIFETRAELRAHRCK